MRFPEYNPPNLPQKEKTLSVAQEERRKAIKTLQETLAKNDPSVSPKVRTARLEALIKLLQEEEKAEHGDVIAPEMMHYTEHRDEAANHSNIEPEKRVA